MNGAIKGYFKRKATFEHVAVLSGLQIRIECHKIFSRNVLLLATVQSSSFEIASPKFDLSSPKLPCIRRDLDECLISRIKPVCL